MQILLNKIFDKLENSMFDIVSRHFKNNSNSRKKCNVSTDTEWEKKWIPIAYSEASFFFNSIM